MKKFLSMLLILSLVIISGCGGCGKETVSAETADTITTVSTIETVSVSEPEPEPEPEPIFTLQDCFGEDIMVLDSVESFTEYLNSRKGMAVRTVVTKRTYNDEGTSDPENSTVETIMQYETYAGYVNTGECDCSMCEDMPEDGMCNCDKCEKEFVERTFDTSRKKVDFEETFKNGYSENAAMIDVYKAIIKGVGLNMYFDTMFISKDTELPEDVVNKALEEKTYRVVSNLPKDVVFNTILKETDHEEIVVGQFSYDLVIDEETNTAYPSYVSAFVQYKNEENKATTYSVNIILIPYEDISEIEEWLTMVCSCGSDCKCGEEGMPTCGCGGCVETKCTCGDDCACPDCEEHNKKEPEPVKDPHNVSYSNSPVPNYPSSVDGYDLTTMHDDGDTFYIYVVSTNHYVKSVDSNQYGEWFGTLQREAEAAYKERGHGSANWHIEDVTSEVGKWYLSEN